jgi:hypothetical protein
MTMKPISRLSLLMGQGGDPDGVFELEIEDIKGKPLE